MPSRTILAAGLLALMAHNAPAVAKGVCTMQWAPVCGVKDGVEKTYSNAGCAKADDAVVALDGECADNTTRPQSVYCTDEYAPVCALKVGVAHLYSNFCRAKADNATITPTAECVVK